MRRAWATWASYALRGAHSESVDSSLFRRFAAEAGPTNTGQYHRLLLTSMLMS